jgi:hypothetical protein
MPFITINCRECSLITRFATKTIIRIGYGGPVFINQPCCHSAILNKGDIGSHSEFIRNTDISAMNSHSGFVHSLRRNVSYNPIGFEFGRGSKGHVKERDFVSRATSACQEIVNTES